jgi:predicted DsbA family dithiol-disulfide isomerase
MTFNSRRAHELGKWAEQQGRGDAFHDAAFRAYFAEGRNFAEINVLEDIVERVSLDPALARQVLGTDTFGEEVDRDWQRSREMGITAVPAFLFEGRILTGAHPYLTLERFLLEGGARLREVA